MSVHDAKSREAHAGRQLLFETRAAIVEIVRRVDDLARASGTGDVNFHRHADIAVEVKKPHGQIAGTVLTERKFRTEIYLLTYVAFDRADHLWIRLCIRRL